MRRLYDIFSHAASWHVARLGPKNFILSQSGYHPFLVLVRIHNSSFHYAVPSNVTLCKSFVFSHSLSPPVIIASHFMHSLMPRKCISANLTIQSSMHQIFTHMYLTVSIGPPYLESLTGFSQAPPPHTAIPHISP